MDLQQRVTLYDPHPGTAFTGALAPLPKALRDLIATLDGTTCTLEEAVARIEPTACAVGAELEVRDQYLGLTYWHQGLRNYYRLMRYRAQ